MSFTLHPNLFESEEAAKKLFLKIIAPNGKYACPRCHSSKHYHLASGHRRCVRCKFTFHAFTHRWINRGRLPFAKWLKIIDAFVLEQSPQKVSEAFNIAYNTAYHCFQTIRYAITASTDDGRELLLNHMDMEMPYFSPKTNHARTDNLTDLVFGIRLFNNQVSVKLIPGLTIQLVYKQGLSFDKIGPFAYTDRFYDFNHLIFYDHRFPERLPDEQPNPNITLSFAWPWAKRRLIIHCGLSARKLPLYLKELEFRFNHHPDELFNKITSYLCQWDISKIPVPN